MTEEKCYSPLKIGLFIVVLSYFLFTLHSTFTLSWIGEWNRFGGSFRFDIFVQDVSGFIGVIFRFAASIMAFVAMIFYFAKQNFSKPTGYKILRWILVFEGIYWLALLTTGVTEIQMLLPASGPIHIMSFLHIFALNDFPVLVESIVPPIALFIFASKLNPEKPQKNAIKWGLITGTIYIFVFWLTNTTQWLTTLDIKGNGYLTSYPENLLSFVLTTFGLLALAIYTAYFAKKSVGKETLQELKLKTIGAIILAFGMYFLWNYLTWIFFGGNYLWSNWYAWFLGHNLDLWLLSLPLLGLPLLFADDLREKTNTQ
ncbi:MAG: hypothetical protein ABSD92_09310 [Candidatus Bathyarchaeia archaeon]|jgi:hypothetical protein